jgi:hypothetical protein
MKLGIFTILLNRSDGDEVQEEFLTWFKGQLADFCDSGIQKLVQDFINVWIVQVTTIKNKVV